MNSHYLFIYIIGRMPDDIENTTKIGRYYQVTNGILIKKLAFQLLDLRKEQVKIFAYEDRQFYNQYIHTNNKYYFLLDLNDIFQMNANSHDLEFKYFFDFKKSVLDIENTIKKEQYTSIIMFLNNNWSNMKSSIRPTDSISISGEIFVRLKILQCDLSNQSEGKWLFKIFIP